MNALTLQPGNPMTKVLMSVVAFEVIIFALGAFVMIQVSGRPVALSLIAALGAAALALLATVMLRSQIGFLLGWLAQIVGIALGFLTPAMFIMGGLFAGLWIISFVLGRRLEANAQ